MAACLPDSLQATSRLRLLVLPKATRWAKVFGIPLGNDRLQRRTGNRKCFCDYGNIAQPSLMVPLIRVVQPVDESIVEKRSATAGHRCSGSSAQLMTIKIAMALHCAVLVSRSSTVQCAIARCCQSFIPAAAAKWVGLS